MGHGFLFEKVHNTVGWTHSFPNATNDFSYNFLILLSMVSSLQVVVSSKSVWEKKNLKTKSILLKYYYFVTKVFYPFAKVWTGRINKAEPPGRDQLISRNVNSN